MVHSSTSSIQFCYFWNSDTMFHAPHAVKPNAFNRGPFGNLVAFGQFWDTIMIASPRNRHVLDEKRRAKNEKYLNARLVGMGMGRMITHVFGLFQLPVVIEIWSINRSVITSMARPAGAWKLCDFDLARRQHYLYVQYAPLDSPRFGLNLSSNAPCESISCCSGTTKTSVLPDPALPPADPLDSHETGKVNYCSRGRGLSGSRTMIHR